MLTAHGVTPSRHVHIVAVAAAAYTFALMPVTPLGIWTGTWVTRRLPAALFFSPCYAVVFAVGLKLLWDGASRLLV